jgi:hypothetical protein
LTIFTTQHSFLINVAICWPLVKIKVAILGKNFLRARPARQQRAPRYVSLLSLAHARVHRDNHCASRADARCRSSRKNRRRRRKKILAASTRSRSRDVDWSSSARRTRCLAVYRSTCRCDVFERAAVDVVRSPHKIALFCGKSPQFCVHKPYCFVRRPALGPPAIRDRR